MMNGDQPMTVDAGAQLASSEHSAKPIETNGDGTPATNEVQAPPTTDAPSAEQLGADVSAEVSGQTSVASSGSQGTPDAPATGVIAAPPEPVSSATSAPVAAVEELIADAAPSEPAPAPGVLGATFTIDVEPPAATSATSEGDVSSAVETPIVAESTTMVIVDAVAPAAPEVTDEPDSSVCNPEIAATTVETATADAPQITEAAAAAPETGAPSEAEPATAKRRIQLNPTVTMDDLRAVPTYGTAEATSGVPVPGVTEAMAAAMMQPPPSGPVELPKAASLEAGLEAEINAALEGTMSSQLAAEVDAAMPATGAIPLTEDQLEPGSKLKAKVQSVSSENVFCDIGFRSPGLLPIKQFPPGKQPREGEEFLVVVDKHDNDNGVVMVSLPKATRRPRGNWEELAVGQIVECVVNKTNKGGLEVTVSNMRAFLPASQVDVGFVSTLDGYVGQRFAVQITEVNPAKRNLVVSRRVLVIQERKEAAAAFWETVEVGQQFAGTVKTIKDYGAFVDLGGVDGFLHVGEMSWTRIKHPGDLLQEGQAIDVVVLSLDREKHKIGLGMRQLAQNPWNIAVEKYAVNSTVSGRVTRTTDFGAFVELEPGVEGLIHISELDHRRVKRVGEVLNVGQEVQAQVLEVNPERQRISLSLKALKAKPEEPKDEDLAPGKGQSYDRKRKEPLRGGTGGSGGGGLFGNPTDFGR